MKEGNLGDSGLRGERGEKLYTGFTGFSGIQVHWVAPSVRQIIFASNLKEPPQSIHRPPPF